MDDVCATSQAWCEVGESNSWDSTDEQLIDDERDAQLQQPFEVEKAKDEMRMVAGCRWFGFEDVENSTQRLAQRMSRFWDRRTVGDRGSGLWICPGHLRRPVRCWREMVGRVENPSETGCRHGRQDDRAREIWRGPSHVNVSRGLTSKTEAVIDLLNMGLTLKRRLRLGANGECTEPVLAEDRARDRE